MRPYVATAQLYVSVGKLWLLVLCYGDLLLRMSRSVDTYVSSFGVPAASAFTKVDGACAAGILFTIRYERMVL